MPFEKPTYEQLENRFKHHAPRGDQAERYAEVRETILSAAADCVRLTPCCAEQTRALNALDEAMFLFNAAIARNE
jgi:alpha-ketoglutarate-dependent taurine dioxygenase